MSNVNVVFLATLNGQQFYTANGSLNAGGNVYTYLAGTLTPANTYTDFTGGVLNPNPIEINNNGFLSNPIWIPEGTALRARVMDTSNVKLQDLDELPGVNDFTSVANIAYTFSGYLNASANGQVNFRIPQTPAEISASVVPTNYQYAPYNVFRYGATGNDSTDDSAAVLEASSLGSVFLLPQATGYLTNTALTGTYGYIAQGNPTFSGANPIGAWIPPFGGTFQVVQTNNENCFVAAQLNNLPANSVAEPCAITGYSRVNTQGNLGFALFGRADLYANAGCATSEVDVFNWSGISANSAFPPNRGFGTTEIVGVAWTVAAGGNAASTIGVQICPEGSSPQKFLCGIYANWNTFTEFGMLFDALLNDTHTTAVLKHSTNQIGLQVQGSGLIFGVAIAGTAGQFTCASTILTVGAQVTVAGTFGGTGSISGYTNPTTYQISATNGTNTFTLQTLVGGALTTTPGTPTGVTFASIQVGGAALLYQDANGDIKFKVSQNGVISIDGNQVLQGQIAGYGTPTGVNRQANFSGGGATLLETSGMLAALIADLKTHGLIGN